MSGNYFGTTSQTEHLDNYVVHMALNPDHECAQVKLFEITFEKYAQIWYVNLSKGSMKSFSELAKKFMVQFASSKRDQQKFYTR